VQLVAAPGHLRQLIAQVREVVRRAVDRLGNVLAVGIVAVGDAAAALAHGRQLTAMLPGIRPRSVVQGVAYGIVGDGFPVERRQQVRPISVAVGIVAVRTWPSKDGHVRQPGYLFLLVGFLILQVRRYFPAPQAFKFDLIMK